MTAARGGSPKPKKTKIEKSMPISAQEADQLRDLLMGLFESKGKILASDVLEMASDPSSPLHKHFEWDDTVAARLHRMDQARRLVRSVKVKIINHRGETLLLNAFVHVPVTEPRKGEGRTSEEVINSRAGYVPIEEVGKSELLSRYKIREMEMEWRRMKRQWGAYAEFWALVAQERQGRSA